HILLRVFLPRDGHRGPNLSLTRPVRQVAYLRDHVAAVAEQEIASLAAERHVALLLREILAHISGRGPNVVDVDSARESLVRSDQDQHRAFALPPAEERARPLRLPL